MAPENHTANRRACDGSKSPQNRFWENLLLGSSGRSQLLGQVVRICCWIQRLDVLLDPAAGPAAGTRDVDATAMLTDSFNLCTNNEITKVMYMTGASPEKTFSKKFAAGNLLLSPVANFQQLDQYIVMRRRCLLTI